MSLVRIAGERNFVPYHTQIRCSLSPGVIQDPFRPEEEYPMPGDVRPGGVGGGPGQRQGPAVPRYHV